MRLTVDQAFTLREPGTGTATPAPEGYTVTATPHGTRVDGPDGGRLLYARPDAPADPPADDLPDGAPSPTRQVDVAIVDVVENPEVIGALRRAGVVGRTTVVVAVGGDHRVHSPAEFERRARLWGASAPSDGHELSCPPAAWPPDRVGGPHRVLITGGARSGKSAEAELRLLGEPEVTYLATGPQPGDDDAWAERIAAHRRRRPTWWKTQETLEAAAVLRDATGAVLFDCVGTWLAGVMDACGLWSDTPPGDALETLAAREAELIDAWRQCPALLVAVTNEVGSGVVPPTASGNLFRDRLGRLNRLLAAESEQVLLATAGRIVDLP
ncbi:bifunctional adenosylcobinamide kinase/adenosylcobinamide-phosphate guanylyltransferase [Nocardiopsis mangrovi]|uniref:Adenosylcobinamide kinase n=1 Tax=Nocardiopsis mangrovi TaxID=1179818 RepID=A0ABV9DS15_9ACTN